MSKLPVKSLLRFKSVSKSWEAIISDPRFSQNYSKRSQNLYLVSYFSPLPTGITFYFMKLEDNKFVVESSLGNPFPGSYPWCSSYSCNGTVLLTDMARMRVYTLWNPSTRKYAKIHCQGDCNWAEYRSGLYYDSGSDDYCIVVVYGRYYSVFSCKSGRWTEEKEQPGRPGGIRDCPRYFDGRFYWLRESPSKNGTGNEIGDSTPEVVCFDFRDEKWRTVEGADIEGKNSELRLMVVSGRLCLCRSREGLLREMWVMEEVGGGRRSMWRKVMNHVAEEDYIPVCLTEEDEVVLHLNQSSEFVVYSSRRKEFLGSWRCGILRRSQILQCSESVAFPDLP